MKQIKVAKEWADEHRACTRSVKRFLRRWPNGLVLNRRNLCMAAEELPINDVRWFARVLLEPWRSQKASDKWRKIRPLAESDGGYAVRAPAKKHAFAKAVADELGLS